jgi:tRNA U34 5-carboxymethylaminomethyl modifying GTPase MnmE/TrmE
MQGMLENTQGKLVNMLARLENRLDFSDYTLEMQHCSHKIQTMRHNFHLKVSKQVRKLPPQLQD